MFIWAVTYSSMRQVPLERDINIAINGPLWVGVANPEHPFTAMLISRSGGTCLICHGYTPFGGGVELVVVVDVVVVGIGVVVVGGGGGGGGGGGVGRG